MDSGLDGLHDQLVLAFKQNVLLHPLSKAPRPHTNVDLLLLTPPDWFRTRSSCGVFGGHYCECIWR